MTADQELRLECLRIAGPHAHANRHDPIQVAEVMRSYVLKGPPVPAAAPQPAPAVQA